MTGTTPTPGPQPPPGGGTLTASDFVTGLNIPWALAFATDGSLYLTERGGAVKRFAAGTLTTLTFASPPAFRVEGEAGLMGLALDPAFATNGRLYLCYSTADAGGNDSNRISRFTLTGTTLESELVLLDDIPGASIHDGCRLTFGPDGLLYASTGDAGNPQLAQDTASLAGKIVRLHPSGGLPSDNPFGNAVWTLGHRNPQGLAFQPGTGRLYSSEHGPSSDDEINLIAKGNNYGWPDVMGTDGTPPYTPALTAYTPTLAVAGIAFYQGSVFADWEGDLLLVSLKAGQLRRLELAADGTISSDEIVYDNDFGRLRDVAVGPDGRIYLATSNRDGRASAPFPGADDDRVIVLERK